MSRPKHVIKAKEITEIPKIKPKHFLNIFLWRIITFFTVIFVAYDLFIYQGIYGLGAQFGLLALYIRYTFPIIRTRGRLITWGILSLVFWVSVIVQEYILPSGSLLFVIPLFLWASYSSEKEKVEIPFEVRFYDDYLVVHWEKRYVVWFNRYFARESHKIYYHDIREVKMESRPKEMLKIYGKVEVIRHQYDRDGRIIEKPKMHKTINNTYTHIVTKDTPEINFIEEIQKHSPITIKAG